MAWINSTYITDDTDALAAKYGEIGTEKSVKYALEAAKYQKVAGLSTETSRKLDILRGGLVLPAPSKDGAAAELSTIATKLNSTYGKGKGTIKGVVKEVCQEKGCWMTMTLDNGDEMRVTFKDYKIFVPKDLGGKEGK